MSEEKNKLVCVTGAIGFIASHLIKRLLEDGYLVRGTVRSLDNITKNKYLLELPHASERLELFEANLLEENSFDEAFKDCEYIFHTASPYIIDTKNPLDDLVKPAESGTENIINSCKKNKTLIRLVLTSSIAAVTDHPISGKTYCEDDWNDQSSLKRNAYFYSKTLAEKKAWSMMKDISDFDLSVINPALVLGPSIIPGLNTSNKLVVDTFKGEYPVIMDLNWGMVDVRDVAIAHIKAIENKSSGRFLCVNKCIDMVEFISILKKQDYDLKKLPSRVWNKSIHNTILKLASYFQGPGTGSYLRNHLGNRLDISNSKIKSELHVEFRELNTTIKDTITDLVSWKHL